MDNTIINTDKVTGLLKRQADRQLDIQKKRNEKKLINAEHEQYTYFTQIFQEKLKDIESSITASEDLDKKEMAYHFDKISREIHSLQKFVADSILFLRGYDIRVCQESLTEIELKVRKLEETLLPKKKFGFKNKQKAKIVEAAHDEIDNIKKPITNKFEDIFFGFRNQKNVDLRLVDEVLLKKDVSLQSLENCVVKLHGAPSTLHMSSLLNCVVLCGPVSTSVFAENCQNCKFVLACQQLRLHSSTKLDVYLHVTSRAIIEDCANVNVAPYNYKYDALDRHFNDSGLDPDINHWSDIDDFNWLVLDKQSPNWAVLEEPLRITNWDTLISINLHNG